MPFACFARWRQRPTNMSRILISSIMELVIIALFITTLTTWISIITHAI